LTGNCSQIAGKESAARAGRGSKVKEKKIPEARRGNEEKNME